MSNSGCPLTVAAVSKRGLPVVESLSSGGVIDEQLTSLLDGLIDAALIVDKDLRPVAWNSAYIQAAGLRPRAFERKVREEGVCCHQLFRLEVCEKECLAARAFSARRSVRLNEIRGGAGNGREKESRLIVSSIPLEDRNGEIIAALEIYRDVSAEARIQERYKLLLEQERRRSVMLEDQVRQRTAELERSLEVLQETRAQLVQTEKLSSLGQLVAGLAHEINNPINFIYGNLDFLKQDVETYKRVVSAYESLALDASEHEIIESVKRETDFAYVSEDLDTLMHAIRSGVERAAGIVRDLRAFVHPGTHERAPVNVIEVVEATINLVKHQLRDRIVVVRSYSEALPLVTGNHGQLGQVFMNLIMNAIQAIPEGRKGNIWITVHPDGDGLAVDVRDDGIGIAEVNLPRVFDPFFTTKPVGKGTGLGLSISYSIINAHGGRISVTSQLGRGTTFCVWLKT